MKIRVGVIFGGKSVEHEISVISALHAIRSIDRQRYDVLPLYIDKSGTIYTGALLTEIENYKNIDELLKRSHPVCLYNEKGTVHVAPIKKSFFLKDFGKLDVVLDIVHGANAEDGTLQGFLDTLQVPYTSSGVIASAVAQDKVFAKCILENAGFKMIPWFWFYKYDYSFDKIANKVRELGFPLIVKPACLGSSIGIQVVSDEEALKEAIAEAAQFDEKILVEKALTEFQEVNCSVFGSIASCRSSVLEKVSDGQMLTYDGKYLTKGNGNGMESLRRQIPAQISDVLTQQVKTLSENAFCVLGAQGVCRIDCLIDKDETVYVNEINTIPGSLAFYLWKEEGVSFTQLLTDMIENALDRAMVKQQLITSFDSDVLKSADHTMKGKKIGKL